MTKFINLLKTQMKDNDTVHYVCCGFCGKGRKEVEKLVVSDDAAICNECVDLCNNMIRKERQDKLMRTNSSSGLLDPIKIKEYLDRHVIGQTNAKMTLSVAVVNHYKRLLLNPEIPIEKSNVLLFGPSGTGKTLLAKTIANYIDVPFVIADATTLTEAGYVGDDVDSVISRLLAEANFDADKAQRGIIFIDEIDKISRKSESNSLAKDVNGEGVQQALLKLVEGTICKVPGHKISESIEIDTGNILFIAGGAFVDLEEVMKNKNSGIGFSSKPKGVDVDFNNITPDDFTRYGMIPEFTGRFPISVHTEKLTIEDLLLILTDVVGNPISQMKFYFEADGIDLEFTDEALNTIAETAYTLSTGARGIRSILERILLPYQFTLVSMKQNGVRKIIITRDVVKDGEPAEFIYE